MKKPCVPELDKYIKKQLNTSKNEKVKVIVRHSLQQRTGSQSGLGSRAPAQKMRGSRAP